MIGQIKPTNKPSVENVEELRYVLDLIKGEEVTIGNGSVVWTVKGGHIDRTGGFTPERGSYPSAKISLVRRSGVGNHQVHYREAHLNQLKIVQG